VFPRRNNVSAGLPGSRIARVALAFPLVLGLTWLSGCGDTYSEAIQYTVRTDPLFTNAPGEQYNDPDRPGQLPLYTIAELEDPRNPFHTKAKEYLDKGTIRDPGKLKEQDRQKLDDVLNQLFGTPAEPKVAGISKAARETLKLDGDTLAEGSRLYRLHCLQCHGVTGDGRGPTAKWVNPHPRDYRQGLFKFQSVDQTVKSDRKPRREDLIRVIHDGVEGTAMPAHNFLPRQELEQLASYVTHLSIRGEAEYQTLVNAFDQDMKPQGSIKAAVEYLKSYVRNTAAPRWVDSQTALITPVPYPKYTEQEMAESVKRGQAQFLAEGGGAVAGCASCHDEYGRQSKFRHDAWGTLVRPANLTAGVYRGGRRPVDLYWRIHSGINGSGMAPFGSSLQGNQIWDLVNFLEALPYPAMRAKYGIHIN
jgi:mono/diheme cytochrome c family protein